MSFDLRLLESFVAIAETLSFAEAAERTNTVQSAVSAHIRALEVRVKRRLVARGRGKPVALTEEGVAFLVQARRMLMLADQMIQEPDTFTHEQPVRVGTTVTFALSVLPQAIADFAQDGNGASVTVRTARSHIMMDLLEREEIDVACVLDQGAHETRCAMFQADLVWAANPGFTWSFTDPVPLVFMDDARDLRRHAYAALDPVAGIETTLSTHPDPVGLRAVLASGSAISVLPKVALAPPLEDVGSKLSLPALGSVIVSIYRRTGTNRDDIERCARSFASTLKGLAETSVMRVGG